MEKNQKCEFQPAIEVIEREYYPQISIELPSEGLQASAYYFNHPEWAEKHLTYCHRSESFCSRWQAALGD